MDAADALGRLDYAGQRLPNPGMVSRPAIRREAVHTSALEGTFTTLPQVLEAEVLEEGKGSKSQEVEEVRRLIRTAELAYDWIRERPLTEGFLKDLHASLMKGDPECPQDQQGVYRTRQNFIGPRRGGILDSHFVPPRPGDEVQDLMEDWIRWIHHDEPPLLVRVAFGHYQLETIHPFFDGNGRIGRLLIILQLMEARRLSFPLLEISGFLEKHADEYRDQLRRLSATGEIDPWIAFFAEGVRTQSVQGLRKVNDLLEWKADALERLHEHRVRGTAIHLVERLIGAPVVVPTRVAEEYGISYPAAVNAIERLEQFDILTRVKTENRRRLYVARGVIRIADR
jgi:Fic family protein